MARRLKTDIPGPDWRVDLETLESLGRGIFGAALERRPLVVDLGFGRGEFLMALAEKSEGVDFLGVEISHKRVLKMARRLARTPLRNVRLCEARAQDVVLRALPAASVHTFWVNFPDPWPKKRHHPRRLLQPAFVGALARVIEPRGMLQVATDHVDYAEWIDGVLAAEPLLANVRDAAWSSDVVGRPHTGYELEWRAEGRNLHFFTYTGCAS
ncbi:MAG: tRNA (guanosine(46)-N7)-methyltransferase TrmB [Deltaproteobacteria bacterium]|nr:tRNA (guanosine(46)-N7)-methyltransferase TrmB [Deltaproteobacteria bacterium]